MSDILSLIYPHRCAGCGNPVTETEGPICVACRARLPLLFPEPYSDHPELLKKFEGLLPIRHAMAFLTFSKGGLTQHLLHGLKYGRQPQIGEVLGQTLGSAVMRAGFVPCFDLILPIPLHQKKLKSRGYNQSMMLAKGLASAFGGQANDEILVRTKATETQTRKGKLLRLLNVDEVFALHPEKQNDVKNKHVLLVDDVITTGSTMEACGRVLMEGKPASLSIATLALAGR